LTALCVHVLVDRGLLDLDAPVGRYWPEFAQHGKEATTARHILSHTAGVPFFEEPISVDEVCNWDLAVSRLAKQVPRWSPGTRLGYHPLTFGHLAGELVRRVSGTSLGSFLRTEVVEPIGGDFHVGTGVEHDARIAALVEPPPEEQANWGGSDADSLLWKATNNPPVGTPAVANSTAFRRAELPGGNGHGDARTVARVYAALANGGSIDGVKLLGADTVGRAIEEQAAGLDCVLQLETRQALGYALSGGWFRATRNPRSFGYLGLGGHMGFADPDAGIGFAYVTNQMRIPEGFHDPRLGRILDALETCL